MQNPLAWLAGAVLLYLATRPRPVGGPLVPVAGGTVPINGRTVPPAPTQECPPGLLAWEGDCVAFSDLPAWRIAEIQQQIAEGLYIQ